MYGSRLTSAEDVPLSEDSPLPLCPPDGDVCPVDASAPLSSVGAAVMQAPTTQRTITKTARM